MSSESVHEIPSFELLIVCDLNDICYCFVCYVLDVKRPKRFSAQKYKNLLLMMLFIRISSTTILFKSIHPVHLIYLKETEERKPLDM